MVGGVRGGHRHCRVRGAAEQAGDRTDGAGRRGSHAARRHARTTSAKALPHPARRNAMTAPGAPARCGRSRGRAAPATGSAGASAARAKRRAPWSHSRSKLPVGPARLRSRSSRQAGRPMPSVKSSTVAAGRGVDPPAGQGGAGLGAAAWRRRRPITPLSRARSASRRLAVRSRVFGWPRSSQRTAARPAQRSPSSNTQSVSCGRRVGDDDEAGRIEPELIEAGAVRQAALPRRLLLDDEEDRPVVEAGEAGEQRGGEAARSGGVARLRGPDLVERIPPEAAGQAGGRRRRCREGAPPRPGAARGAAAPEQGGPERRRSAPAHSQAGYSGRPKSWPALDFGDAAGEPGKRLPRHENACAHGLRTCWLRICS